MKTKFFNVCDVIVKNDFCIGCGICSGVCPAQVLEMQFNSFGEYQPIEYKAGCLPTCDICLRACPFWNQDQNEETLAKELFSTDPKIKHNIETGYYIDSYVGYSKKNEQRLDGASGGLATWLLESLFEHNLVDKAISVLSNPEPGKLFKFAVHNSIEEIRYASKSAYYPVELSEVLDYIKNNDDRYVITALPCFSKGLRLATKVNKKFRDRIKFIVGLVCGQSQSKYFAEYLCRLKGGNPKTMDKALFRIKDLNRPASDFGFHFLCKSGNVKTGEIFWNEGMGEIWNDGCFTPNACYFCDDIFAETADVVFMDAWLPEYRSDPQGTNLLIVRNTQIYDLLAHGSNNEEIHLQPIGVNKIIKSQAGVIHKKRNELSYRTQHQSQKTGYYPIKRFLGFYKISALEKIKIKYKEQIRQLGRECFRINKRKKIYNKQIIVLKIFLAVVSKITSLFFRIKHKFLRIIGK
jgi:coenzyme F420-reducing hydrogenase beta subunit